MGGAIIDILSHNLNTQENLSEPSQGSLEQERIADIEKKKYQKEETSDDDAESILRIDPVLIRSMTPMSLLGGGDKDDECDSAKIKKKMDKMMKGLKRQRKTLQIDSD